MVAGEHATVTKIARMIHAVVGNLPETMLLPFFVSEHTRAKAPGLHAHGLQPVDFNYRVFSRIRG
jgi:hypothetical protein